MYSPHPPHPSYSPRPGVASGESDERLAAQLRGRAEGATGRPVALLLARHWQSAYDYTVICLASSGNVASMATAAAFRQVFATLGRGESAGGRGMRAAKSMASTKRELAERSFHALPGPAR